MENFFDTAPCCYFSFNDNGELLRLNQTLCAALGYTKEELMGRKVEIIFPIPTRIFYQTHFFPLLKMQGQATEIFIFLLCKNGEQLPVLMNARREEKQGLVYNECVSIIVQNRKKFEDELVGAKKIAEAALLENSGLKKAREDLISQAENLDDQLQLVNKQNNILKQLNKVATHDLQEPLRKLLIYANLLNDEPTGDLKQKGKIRKLMHAAHLMRETLSGLQQFVWLNEATIHPQDIDLNLILVAVKKQLADELQEDILDINAEKLPVIKADNYQLCLLFYHLLNNAVQYRKPGERAQVSVTATLLKKNRFVETAGRYKYQDFLKIYIKDDGIGFDPQYKNLVFELFKKLHHLDRRGLGLSLCKLIVENHRGSIDADSKPFEGTGISIFFPGNICNKNIENNHAGTYHTSK